MSKMKEQAGELPFGTEEDGVASILISDLDGMDRELDLRLEAINVLTKRLIEIVIDNDLDEVYNLEETICVCDKCLEKERNKDGEVTAN